MKVLIVDDEDGTRELCTMILEDLPVKISESNNGTKAWSLFQEEKFDIVVTDMRMPGGLNGLQLAEKILDKHQDIPVLIITGFDEKETILKAMQLGVSDFILKPFTNEYFMDRVKRAMDKRTLMRK
jgi:DNA-binding NtrC family response regulator